MKSYNKFIDHTLLKPNADADMIKQLCVEAKTHDFASVCVNPYWVSYCKELLCDSDVKVCTVIGFPLGANTSIVKANEASQAVIDGADELDMVINIGLLKQGLIDEVAQDISAVVKAANGKTVKVIIETCLLTDQEKIGACQAAVKANADFVKTSTGFSTGGATIADVELMKKHITSTMQVKASGGVKTFDDMLLMIDAGATRIGTSSGVALVSGKKTEGSY